METIKHKLSKLTQLWLALALVVSCMAFTMARAQALAPYCFTADNTVDCKSVPAKGFPDGKGAQADKCYLVSNDHQSAQYAACKDCTAPSDQLNASNCGIVRYLKIFINALSGLVGIVLVIVITWAGIQWSTAGSNPQQVANAKTRIFNAIVAMALFIFMYTLLQWLVPGGVL